MLKRKFGGGSIVIYFFAQISSLFWRDMGMGFENFLFLTFFRGGKLSHKKRENWGGVGIWWPKAANFVHPPLRMILTASPSTFFKLLNCLSLFPTSSYLRVQNHTSVPPNPVLRLHSISQANPSGQKRVIKGSCTQISKVHISIKKLGI